MSYRTLNQIFYTNNKFDDATEIQRLEQYFMNLSIDMEQDVLKPKASPIYLNQIILKLILMFF